MRLLKYLPLLLCLTVSPAQSADDSIFGIGAQLRAEGKNIVVNRILSDSPASAQNNLHDGDRIVAVAQGNDPSVQAQTLKQTALMIRGPKGTTVRLTIIPAGDDNSQVRVVSFVRGEVQMPWGDGQLLAIGSTIPDVDFVEVANKVPERLSKYAGKILVLEFWGTWCGPCQLKMAELQSYLDKYYDWHNKVVLITASIDESSEIAAKYLNAKGWNKTHNIWADVATIRAYHINSIPTVYVIDRQGRIVAVNPSDLSQVVNHELEQEKATGTK